MASRAHRWRLLYLLVFLVLYLVLASFSAGGMVRQAILNLILVGILASVIAGIRQTRRWLYLSLTMGVAWIGLAAVNMFTGNMYTIFAASLAGTAFMALTASTVLRHVVRSREVTVDVIYGAMSVYLLIGLAWAGLYRMLEVVQPGSFSGPLGIDPSTGIEQQAYTYFSFVTLATLGYGDIAPLTSPARALAVLQAVAGPFYIAILISRLVSTYVSQSMQKRGGQGGA